MKNIFYILLAFSTSLIQGPSMAEEIVMFNGKELVCCFRNSGFVSEKNIYSLLEPKDCKEVFEGIIVEMSKCEN